MAAAAPPGTPPFPSSLPNLIYAALFRRPFHDRVEVLMDLPGRLTARRVWSRPPSAPSPRSSSPSSLRTRCSRDGSRRPPDNRGDDEDSRPSTDWDKAWSSFKKRGKKSLLSQFNPGKYVTWNPRRSEYPLSEEIDPIKRTERSNLVLWTSPMFTLVGAIVVITMLLVYTLVAPMK